MILSEVETAHVCDLASSWGNGTYWSGNGEVGRSGSDPGVLPRKRVLRNIRLNEAQIGLETESIGTKIRRWITQNDQLLGGTSDPAERVTSARERR